MVEPRKSLEMEDGLRQKAEETKKAGGPGAVWWGVTAGLVVATLIISYFAFGSGATTKAEEAGLPGLLETFGNCGLAKADKKLLLLSSKGVEGDIEKDLDKLVLALPGQRPDKDGKPKYNELKLLTIYDPCWLKKSFWAAEDEAEGSTKEDRGSILHFPDELGDKFSGVSDFLKDKKVDGSFCCREEVAVSGGLGQFTWAKTESLSIMGELMTKDQFEKLVLANQGGDQLDVSTWKPEQEALDRVKKKISEADVIAVSGGNPDLMTFVLRAFPTVAETLTARISSGQAVYLGRSAGAMVTSAMATFSDEPTTEMFTGVLGGDPKGLDWLPGCVVKPHFAMEKHEVQAFAVEAASGKKVVRIPNFWAFSCKQGKCWMSYKNEDAKWGKWRDFNQVIVKDAQPHLKLFLAKIKVPLPEVE